MKSLLKSIRNVMIITGLLLILAACGGNAPAATAVPATTDAGPSSETAGGGTPDATVSLFFESLFEGTGTTSDFLCSSLTAEQKTQIEDGYKQVSAAFASSGATIDTAGLTFTVKDETADKANVEVGGNLSIDMSGTKTDVPMSGVVVPVTKDGDAWKVCS